MPLEAELGESGTLRIRAASPRVEVWSVEFSFKTEISRIECGKEKRIVAHLSDKIKLKKALKLGENIEIELGLPRDRLVEVIVHYAEAGRYYKLKVL
ncbi:MAG: hypothetical protein QW405_00815 [Fervidicoccaceae archaeon]